MKIRYIIILIAALLSTMVYIGEGDRKAMAECKKTHSVAVCSHTLKIGDY